jgi:hypothetical protein
MEALTYEIDRPKPCVIATNAAGYKVTSSPPSYRFNRVP